MITHYEPEPLTVSETEGSLAFIATEAWSTNYFKIGSGTAGDFSPSTAVFIGLVLLLIFNYVGFELQNGPLRRCRTRNATCRGRLRESES